MSMSPDHRAIRIHEGGEPQNETEQEYLDALNGESKHEYLLYAKDIYDNDYKSEVIEAFLLAGAKNNDVAAVLRVPAQVVNVYRFLFFDTEVFKDELDVEAYAQGYGESEFGKEIKVCAVTLGIDYLRYRFGRNKKHDISMVDALSSMIETGYVLSKATRLNPLDSNSAREARQWMMSAIKGMESYIKVKPALEEYNDEFRIALQKIDSQTEERISTIIPEEEIIH